MPNDQLTRIPASRVPVINASTGIMTREWYRYLFNLFTLAGGGQANSAASSSMGQDLAPAYTPQMNEKRYGAFYDTTSQTAAAINTAYPVRFSNATLSKGVYIGTPTSRIYVDRVGTYNFQFSIQLNKASATTKSVYIWCRINGVDVLYSGTDVTLSGSSGALVAAWNFVPTMDAGDYFELVWSTNDIDCFISSVVAAPPVPGIPSVILTVTDNIN